MIRSGSDTDTDDGRDAQLLSGPGRRRPSSGIMRASMPDWTLLLRSPAFETTALLLGLVGGSFANVCGYRPPRRQSIVSPPSRCPSCGALIRARDNVPVLSWLVLRGRCRSWRAPART